MALLTKDTLERCIIELLRQSYPDLIAIYVFGSFERGAMRPESDIDLAILTTQTLGACDRWHLAQRLANIINREVDLVDLKKASTVMRMQVISTGRCLYESDPSERDRFEDYVYSSYARLNEERREIIHDIEIRGTVYG